MTVGLVVSASIMFLSSFAVDGPPRDDGPVDERLEVPDEAVAPNQEPERRPWLTDYNLHVPLLGGFYVPIDPHPRPDGDLDPVDSFESDALMDSLSPGVRTRLQGMIRELEEARRAAFPEWPVVRPSHHDGLTPSGS
ncbi:MAG: hypothetical protein KJO40_09240 [Deltaproteobacteria bacterium]|nr:hypothetical protein [Deltaproteobacteria bacterium]MBT8465547.1 hypothetical protein [Deltaproteobacteria bacterium]MBT8480619.1 hypothetical protein [Deltaproteobacteria bacterium]NNK43142.1 hypothetical protein [Myxococcales bacterium]NNL23485.1 hypothetical protein [Myxococcales bacterium]